MANPFYRVREEWKVRPGYWFVPKRFGIGATPATWQGWALLLGYAALMILEVRVLRGVEVRVIVGTVLTALVLYLSWLKTDGGWHWHWGARR